MESIVEIIGEHGGSDFLFRNHKIRFATEPSGFLEIRSIENSPTHLPAISIIFLDESSSPSKVLEMHLEITDLGWFPFYFRNDYLDFEGSVYRIDNSGKVIDVDHALKRILIEVVESWDEQIRDYGIENFLPIAGGAV